MKQLLAAVRFLTILPLPGSCGTAAEDLAGSAPWFPVVGLLLGAVAAGAAAGLAQVLPPLVTAGLLIILLLAFSGCLHLDGLSDSADACLSSRTRERMLEIMKDSHTGAMGVVAVVSVLLLKFAALASLPNHVLAPTVLLMPLAGRCAMVIHMALLPSARPDGLGALFYQHRPRGAAVGAALVLAAAGWWCLKRQDLEGRGLVIAAACIVVTAGLAWYVHRKLGGTTGDTFGAVCEIVEVVPALTMCIGPLGAWGYG